MKIVLLLDRISWVRVQEIGYAGRRQVGNLSGRRHVHLVLALSLDAEIGAAGICPTSRIYTFHPQK